MPSLSYGSLIATAGQQSSGPRKSLHPALTERCGESNHLKIAVGIATVGRPQILNETLRELRKQERQPDRTLIGHCTDNDIAGLRVDKGQIGYVRAPLGLTSQRNAILNAARGFDMWCFSMMIFFRVRNILR